MGMLIHGRRRDGQWRYRLWSTMCDEYATAELTEKQLRRELLLDYPQRQIEDGMADRYITERLERVHRNGTSSRVEDAQPVDGPWCVEKCPHGRFHHQFNSFDALDGRLCRDCGEPESDHAHRPECRKQEPTR